MPTTTPSPSAPLVARVIQRLHQFVCGLHGHDSLVHFERRRLSLRCMTCDYQSRGWDVAPVHERAGEAATRPVAVPLARARRVA